MANVSTQSHALEGFWTSWQVFGASIGLALLAAYPVGMLLNVLSGNGANCIELFDISGCNFPNPFVYYIGIIYALPFCLGVFHFGFTDKKRWWYYIIALLFAKLLYVGNDSLIYEIVAIGGGAVVGFAVSAWRNKKI